MVDVDEETVKQWNREIALVRLTGACPFCDGEVGRSILRGIDGNRVVDWQCTDCHEQWIAQADALPGTVRSDFQT